MGFTSPESEENTSVYRDFLLFHPFLGTVTSRPRSLRCSLALSPYLFLHISLSQTSPSLIHSLSLQDILRIQATVRTYKLLLVGL